MKKALTLNPFVPEANSLMGLYNLHQDDFNTALFYYEKAYNYSGKDVYFLYDVCYVLNILESYSETIKKIREANFEKIKNEEEYYVGLTILLIEAYMNEDNLDSARSLYKQVYEQYPENELLLENRKHLLTS